MRETPIQAFVAGEQGATAIEYALIAGGVFLAIILPVNLMGSKLSATYATIMKFFP